MRNDKKLSDSKLEAIVDNHLARKRKKTKEPVPGWMLEFMFSTSFVMLFGVAGYVIDNYLAPSHYSMGLFVAVGSVIGSFFLKEVKLNLYKLFLRFFAAINVISFIVIHLFLKIK